MASETWRVVLASGEVREVVVTRWGDRWGAQCGDAMTMLCGSPLRAVLAVVESLGAAGLDPRAVLAPEAVEELARVTAERDALRAIIEGRTVAPTDAEIAAHEAACGRWLVSHPRGLFAWLASGEVDAIRTRCAAEGWDGVVWRALDASGRPCAWPEVSR